MVMSTTTAKVVYTGNGTTGPFTFSFKIFASTDLVVEKYTIADGTTTTMVVTTDYTVSGTFPGTGSITLVSSLSSSYKLIIRRSVPYTQATDLQENDDLPADTIETMSDRGVALVQQVKEVADRAVVLDSTNSTGVTLPTFVSQALKYLRVNSGETGIEYGTPTTTTTSYGATISYGVDASKAVSPTAGDIYIATDTFRVYRCYSGGTWTTKLDFSNTVTFTGAALNFAKGADIASATTTDIGAATGNFVDITGTTTITGLGTVQAGTHRWVRFSGALTLTHNASSLILPGGASITTAAGDTALFVSLGSGNWRCLFYSKASGLPIVAPTVFTPNNYSSAPDSSSSDETTTSSTYSDTTLSQTFTVGQSGLVFADFSGRGDSSSGICFFSLKVDGTIQAEQAIPSGVAGTPLSLSWCGILGAGSHTIKISFRNTDNVSTMTLKGTSVTARLNIQYPT